MLGQGSPLLKFNRNQKHGNAGPTESTVWATTYRIPPGLPDYAGLEKVMN
jgi:hypothetical protein